MSVFGKIMNRIFHPKAAQQPAPEMAGTQQGAAPSPNSATPQSQQAPAASTQPVSQNVDVGAVLSEMAATKGGGGNYQSSIVDLLKLLDLDSSLSARKELADELNVHAGQDGSAEENIALHRAVMDKLAQNGGVVPDNLRH